MNQKYLTVAEAAAMANAHQETIRRAYQCRALKVHRVGRSIRIPPADLQVWLEGGGRTRAAA